MASTIIVPLYRQGRKDLQRPNDQSKLVVGPRVYQSVIAATMLLRNHLNSRDYSNKCLSSAMGLQGECGLAGLVWAWLGGSASVCRYMD